MNEINKMKAEHARYKKALTTLTENHSVPGFVSRIASEALNSPPITLGDILAVLLSKNGDYTHPSIHIFSDGSATIHLPVGTKVFTTVRQALDYLNKTEGPV